MFVPGACALGYGIAGGHGAFVAVQVIMVLVGVATLTHLMVALVRRYKPPETAAGLAQAPECEPPVSYARVPAGPRRDS